MQYTFKLIEAETGRVFIPALYSSSQLSSNFNRIKTESTIRMMSGTPDRVAMDWEKGSITISASGTVPPGLDDINKTKTYSYYSFLSRSSLLTHTLSGESLSASSTASKLAFSVRNDEGYEPFIVVSYSDGTTETFHNVVIDSVQGNPIRRTYSATLTRTDVEVVHEVYYPIFEVYTAPASVDYDHRSNVYGWTMDLEII